MCNSFTILFKVPSLESSPCHTAVDDDPVCAENIPEFYPPPGLFLGSIIESPIDMDFTEILPVSIFHPKKEIDFL